MWTFASSVCTKKTKLLIPHNSAIKKLEKELMTLEGDQHEMLSQEERAVLEELKANVREAAEKNVTLQIHLWTIKVCSSGVLV